MTFDFTKLAPHALVDKGRIYALETGVTVALVKAKPGGWWQCLVVASSHPSYPVGGYDLQIHADELAKGQKLEVHL